MSDAPKTYSSFLGKSVYDMTREELLVVVEHLGKAWLDSVRRAEADRQFYTDLMKAMSRSRP